jgi:septum formation protein
MTLDRLPRDPTPGNLGPQLDRFEPRREHAPVLVLASGSPRRRQLLRWLLAEFLLETPDVDESAAPGEVADVLVGRLACAKAAAVAARHPGDWVLAADTVVEIDGQVLGKPMDAAEAKTMLGWLAGREHRVFTGFALAAPGERIVTREVVVSRVHFRELDAATIATYVESGEPMDKAGGYAAQGLGVGLIERVDGSFTNVIGLPLAEVGHALTRAGLRG